MCKVISLDEVASTSTWLLDALRRGEALADGTVVTAVRQTAGRGQMGNVWESAEGKNVTFSMLLRPDFILPREQFVLSEMVAVAVANALRSLLPEDMGRKVSIKWPNDIYVADEKICGMLLECQLQGMKIAYSVAGIGLNVNQERWLGNAPNPTSMKLVAGREFSTESVLCAVVERILANYDRLRADVTFRTTVHDEFCAMLYRRDGLYPYVDAATGEAFQARIAGVEPMGPLRLITADGEERTYSFKEVKFVLPCGVTKE